MSRLSLSSMDAGCLPAGVQGHFWSGDVDRADKGCWRTRSQFGWHGCVVHDSMLEDPSRSDERESHHQ